MSVGLGFLEIWVFLAAWAATAGCGAGDPAPSHHRQGRVPEPAPRWKREEAERTVKPVALSDLPVFAAEPEPSSSSAAQPAPSPLSLGSCKSLPGPFMVPGDPSQDPLGRSGFSNTVGLGSHPSPAWRSGLHRHKCMHSLQPCGTDLVPVGSVLWGSQHPSLPKAPSSL